MNHIVFVVYPIKEPKEGGKRTKEEPLKGRENKVLSGSQIVSLTDFSPTGSSSLII